MKKESIIFFNLLKLVLVLIIVGSLIQIHPQTIGDRIATVIIPSILIIDFLILIIEKIIKLKKEEVL